MKKLIALVFALAASMADPAAAQWGSRWCPTCYVASHVDTATPSHLAGWAFECGSGALISHVDAYYYDADGSLHRLADAYIVNGLWREDVSRYFLNGGGCPRVPIASGWHIYFPTPPPAGSTVALVLWHGWIYSTQYVTV